MITYSEKIYYDYTDAGGVVYYSRYLQFCERAKQEFMLKNGCDLFNLHNEGTYLTVKEVKGKYIKAIRFGETINVDVKIKQLKGASVILSFDILVNGETRATFEILSVCVDRELKVKKLPSCFDSLR